MLYNLWSGLGLVCRKKGTLFDEKICGYIWEKKTLLLFFIFVMLIEIFMTFLTFVGIFCLVLLGTPRNLYSWYSNKKVWKHTTIQVHKQTKEERQSKPKINFCLDFWKNFTVHTTQPCSQPHLCLSTHEFSTIFAISHIKKSWRESTLD